MLPSKAWLYIALTIFPVSAIYLGTFDSYFVADDFWQVHYSARTLNGELDLFWRNFTSNYVQLPGANFYRPILGLSYLIDYAIWRTNPFGYHLTNVILYVTNIILLFLLTLNILPEKKSQNAAVTAFLSALLFASTPLHAEAVAWISGRADVLAGVFYLLSLVLFLHSNLSFKSKFYLLSLLSYALALGTKEISIGLPLVIFALSFFVMKIKTLKTDDEAASPSQNTKSNFKTQLGKSTAVTLPFIALALTYLGIRLICFGTILGGYIGGFGSSKSQYVLNRWFDFSIWLRIILPFNKTVSQDLGILALILILALFLSFLMLLIKLILDSQPYKLIAFCSLWMISTLIPLFGVWGIDQFLHNSRLVFFFTMPLSLVLPILLFNDSPKKNKPQRPKIERLSTIMSMFALLTISVVYFYLTIRIDGLWLEAGRITKGLQLECIRVAKELKQNEKTAILGIPGDFYGAFVILNGSTFHHMMSPPLSKDDYSSQLVTFKPFIFGHENYINPSRFKSLVSSKTPVKSVHLWNTRTKKLKRIDLKPISKNVPELKLPFVTGIAKQSSKVAIIGKHKFLENNTIALGNSIKRPGLKIHKLNINPLDYDFVRFLVKSKRKAKGRNSLTPVMVWWNKNRANNIIGAVPSNLKSLKPTVIGLSQYWKWYQTNEIKELEVIFGKASEIQVSNLSLLNSKSVIPQLTIENLAPLNSGEYVLQNSEVQINWNASSIENATNVILEVSKPNFFFDGPTLKSSIRNVQTFFNIEGSKILNSNLFEEGSYTQLRMLAVDRKGLPVSQYSDPVTIFLNQSKTRNSFVF